LALSLKSSALDIVLLEPSTPAIAPEAGFMITPDLHAVSGLRIDPQAQYRAAP